MIRLLDKTTDWIILIVLFFLFLMGAYIIYDTLYVYSGASHSGTMIYKPGGEEEMAYELKELSEDVVAWITIDESGVDFPVMQGKTNSQYLNTNPYGEYSIGGSIFVDTRNAADFSDDYNMIYGHHMENNTMFGTLDAFAQEEYFESHRTGTLTLTDHTVFEIDVFAYGVGDVSHDELFDLDTPFTLDQRMDYIKREAVYFHEPKTMHLVALTTCKKPSGTDRTFVMCSIAELEKGTQERAEGAENEE